MLAVAFLHHRRLDNRLPSQPVRGGWIVRRVDKICGHQADRAPSSVARGNVRLTSGDYRAYVKNPACRSQPVSQGRSSSAATDALCDLRRGATN